MELTGFHHFTLNITAIINDLHMVIVYILALINTKLNKQIINTLIIITII